MSELTKLDPYLQSKLSSMCGFMPTHMVHITMPSGHHQEILNKIIAARDWIDLNAATSAHPHPPVYYFKDEELALQFYLTFG